LQQPDHGGALLIRGPAGIGKSALVNDAIRRASRSRRLLRATGTPPESGLEFAGLYQLLRPVMAQAGSIPAARRAALNVAFGLADGTAPQRYAVAMAALELLAEVAVGQPLLAAAEDLHWMDPATVTVLGFIGRRLESDAIALIATIRDDVPNPIQDPALTVLELAPLTESASLELLAGAAPELGPHAQRRILTAAAGNPLALIELPQAPDWTSNAVEDTGWLPLGSRLRAAFAGRAESLPEDSRTALALLALHDSDALPEPLSALPIAGVHTGVGALTAAAEAGLVELSASSLTFRHPLMRSAVCELTSPDIRVTGHSAPAEAIGAKTTAVSCTGPGPPPASTRRSPMRSPPWRSGPRAAARSPPPCQH
jgi:AAA ATPase domain